MGWFKRQVEAGTLSPLEEAWKRHDEREAKIAEQRQRQNEVRAAVDKALMAAADNLHAHAEKAKVAGRKAADNNTPFSPPLDGCFTAVLRSTLYGEPVDRPGDFEQFRPIIWAHYWREGFNERIAECKQIVATAKRKPLPTIGDES